MSIFSFFIEVEHIIIFHLFANSFMFTVIHRITFINWLGVHSTDFRCRISCTCVFICIYIYVCIFKVANKISYEYFYSHFNISTLSYPSYIFQLQNVHLNLHMLEFFLRYAFLGEYFYLYLYGPFLFFNGNFSLFLFLNMIILRMGL